MAAQGHKMNAGYYARDILLHGHSQECHTSPRMANHMCPRHSNWRSAHLNYHILRATPSTTGQGSSQSPWRAATGQGGRQGKCPQHHQDQGQMLQCSPTRGRDRNRGLPAPKDPKASPSKGATHMIITAKKREHIYNPIGHTAMTGESRYGMQMRQMICRLSSRQNMWQARPKPPKKLRLK